MITEYVSDAKSLDQYVRVLCCTPECRSSNQALRSSLQNLAIIIYQISSAFNYMHTVAKLLHFDIKPENILMSPDGIPYVTDLGFARDLTKYKPNEPVEVGFTWRYAHPRLMDPHRGARVTKVPEKAKTPLTGKELSPCFDIFSFGRTLQELLAVLEVEYGEFIHSQYAFGYIHLLACLCLDGFNGAPKDSATVGGFISDRFTHMPPKIFEINKFTKFENIEICLQRLLGLRRFEDDLEEVDPCYGSTIKVSDTGSTTLTSRVASMINHPALQRLKKETQLGFLESIFPTATHTRFQHTLGTYHAATQYLLALYYDPDNPVFRALVDIRKCAILLLASLIHDLGHSAYGHELEEIDDSEFDHEKYVPHIVVSKAFLDANGRTLKELIEGVGEGCWGLSTKDVFDFFNDKLSPTSAIDGVLYDILDSQIDADKFDYLIRDSVECRVNYGHGIDYDRFLKSLTTHPNEDGVLRLAIKQKGAASAEAFALARYQLYQSLYWHHTFRATKTMLLEAVRLIFEDIRREGEGGVDIFDQHPFSTGYIQNVLGVNDYIPVKTSEAKKAQKGKKGKKATGQKNGGSLTINEVVNTRLQTNPSEPISASHKDDKALNFFWRLSSGLSRELLKDLVNRNYYKRLIEISSDQLSLPNWQKLRDKFRFMEDRGKMQSDVQKSLLNSLRSEVQGKSLERTSLVEDKILVKIETLAKTRVLFLVDIPLRGWFASSEYPVYVSDYKRRHFRAESAKTGYEGKESFWIDTLGDLMKKIAFICIFCEPEVHSIMTRVMSTNAILMAVKDAIPDIKYIKA